MSTALKAVVGNTAPSYTITCERDDGTIIDLSGCTVTMKLYFGKTQTNTTSGHDACTIVSASAGTVTWIPKTGDLPSKGSYKGDVKVTYGDSTFEVLYGNFLLKTRNLLSS